jgi:hypothetical protein
METDINGKNILDLYRGFDEFKLDKPRASPVRDGTGDQHAYFHILKRWEND